MERIKLTDSKQITGQSIEQYFLLNDLSDVLIPENVFVNLLILDFQDQHLKIDVQEGSKVIVSLLCENNLDGSTIEINVHKNAVVDVYFADFSFGKEHLQYMAHLLEPGASVNWHLASLTSKEDNKTFDVSVKHVAPSTFAKMDNYGVCKDNGKLVFSGTSSIKKGAKSSKTHQNAKIMVFDKESIGIAKPILKIDENDIEASHAAVVGKINDDHLFYLTSRGLSESAAKELITFGYLKPILNGFIEEDIKEKILGLIERRM